MDLWQVISALLAIVTIVFGTKFASVKKAISEVSDIAGSLGRALEDNKITPEELKGITQEAKEALTAITNIFK